MYGFLLLALFHVREQRFNIEEERVSIANPYPSKLKIFFIPLKISLTVRLANESYERESKVIFTIRKIEILFYVTVSFNICRRTEIFNSRFERYVRILRVAIFSPE